MRGLERGDIRKAVEIALRTWPNKSQQEIAEQVGCSQQYVGKIQDELTTSCKLTLPATRTGKDGKDRPTTYATRTTRTATSATGTGRDIRPDILPDIRRTGDRPGHDARGLPEHP